ncbi:Scr1 family TA system antitoxin-like transcriptional regulator [Nonomuraea salmonea]|uniref:Scr1 family TA system antitoxin-like transcriptional regulator n=1 Tax=Nonomuraea salmonea TaxID=46181 RepID=UPI003CD073E1
MDECALLRPVGGKDVMREQLQHLLSMTQRLNISLQVVPLDVGATAGVAGGFSIAQGDGIPDHVSINAAAQDVVSAREDIVRLLKVRYDAIHKWAQPVHISQCLLHEVAARYGD